MGSGLEGVSWIDGTAAAFGYKSEAYKKGYYKALRQDMEKENRRKARLIAVKMEAWHKSPAKRRQITAELIKSGISETQLRRLESESDEQFFSFQGKAPTLEEREQQYFQEYQMQDRHLFPEYFVDA